MTTSFMRRNANPLNSAWVTAVESLEVLSAAASTPAFSSSRSWGGGFAPPPPPEKGGKGREKTTGQGLDVNRKVHLCGFLITAESLRAPREMGKCEVLEKS